MTTSARKKYPVGIQTFETMIRDGYVYVDKSDLVWKLANDTKYAFLSRPRRFGKSLLTTTLASYFRGEQELFEGLKIMELEKEWKQYPVVHIDLSTVKNRESVDELRRALALTLDQYLERYGRYNAEDTPGAMLSGCINRAYRQSGRKVVLLVDEYDSPLLDVLHEKETLEKFKKVMQEFYQPLKACESMIQFCFVTGITKFSQLSIFSTLNNITNISMMPEFATICGITELNWSRH